jgi:pimeloyl-ACP methyl ester carboxylesterase
VRDSDVVRYQWPSIGKGWERGLLKFARAQKRHDDERLLKQVLDLPNTTVAVIIGTKDKVIPPRVTTDFLSTFQDQNIQVVPMEGLGHNTFEEDVEAFMSVVEKISNVEKQNHKEK